MYLATISNNFICAYPNPTSKIVYVLHFSTAWTWVWWFAWVVLSIWRVWRCNQWWGGNRLWANSDSRWTGFIAWETGVCWWWILFRIVCWLNWSRLFVQCRAIFCKTMTFRYLIYYTNLKSLFFIQPSQSLVLFYRTHS